MYEQIHYNDVKRAVEQSACLAKQYLNQHKNQTNISAWLPCGVIRKIDDLTSRWPYLPYDRKRTCACVVQLCDVNRYFMNVYRVGLTAGSMFVWHCSLPVIALIETLIYQVARNEDWVNKGAEFKKCINVLNSRGIYGEIMKQRLHELRLSRNDIHIQSRVASVAIHDGKPRLYNKSVIRLKKLELLLMEHYRKRVN